MQHKQSNKLTNMKRLVLPLVLVSFAFVCLCIVHIDNINKLERESNRLQEKQNALTELQKIKKEPVVTSLVK